MEPAETLVDVRSEHQSEMIEGEKQPKATALDIAMRKSRRRCNCYRAVLRRLRKDQVRLMNTIGQLQVEHRQCFEIVAACQQQTAGVLNHTLEKQSLYPAIECVAALAGEIGELCNTLKRADAQPVVEKVKLMEEELSVSLCLAQQKMSAMEIETLCPKTEELLDSNKHTVCGYQPTEDPGFHGKISQVVQEGVLYRGKILRSAKVLVYRYDKDVQNSFNERDKT